jgi:hypothetical protein
MSLNVDSEKAIDDNVLRGTSISMINLRLVSSHVKKNGIAKASFV